MKCLATLVLSICLVLVIGGCTGRQGISADIPSEEESTAVPTEAPVDPYKLYTNAREKQSNSAADENLEFKGKLISESMDITVTSEITGKLQAHYDNENTQYLQEMTVNAIGQKILSYIYFTDGYVYSQGCRQKITWESLSANSIDNSMSFEENELRDAEVTTQNGNTVLKGVVSSQNIKTYLSQIVSGLGGSLASYTNIQYSDPTLNCTIDQEGWLVAYSITYEVSGQVEGPDINNPGNTKKSPTSLKVEYSYTLVNPGQTVDVTFPEDLDEYVELPESKLSIQEILYIDSFLFDENGDPVENFDEIYSAFAQVYGEDTLDAIYYREQVT